MVECQIRHEGKVCVTADWGLAVAGTTTAVGPSVACHRRAATLGAALGRSALEPAGLGDKVGDYAALALLD